MVRLTGFRNAAPILNFTSVAVWMARALRHGESS
jgi:hypothetical protein